jgi:predicted ATPase
VNFQLALQCAREQCALAWELRAATSLARLWLRQDRHPDAHRILNPICERFTEGRTTADWLQAQALLRDIS